MHTKQKKQMEKERKTAKKELLKESPSANTKLSDAMTARFAYRMNAPTRDANVKYLKDPFLSVL